MRQSFIIIVLFFSISIPNVFAAPLSGSLVRMDAIIKEMQALRAEFAKLTESAVVATPVPSVLGAQTKSFFTQSLEVGETNSDIKKIQKLLATDPEIYPYGVASGFFGPKTEEGIKNFQTRFGLSAVGVVGPSTKTLFELFFSAYPDDIYPNDVLKKKPSVLGVSTSLTPTTVAATASVVPVVASGKSIDVITARYKDGEADVKVTYGDGTSKRLSVSGDSKLKVIDAVALALGEKKATILGSIEFVSGSNTTEEEEDEDEEENDDEDAIDSITVAIKNGEAQVEVEYANGDDEDFTLEETKEAKIIEEIADELNVDENDVEDVIEFEYEDVEKIDVTIDEENDSALAIVTFEDGTTKRVKIASSDEDDIIEELTDKLDEDEGDVEDWTDFDY